MKLLRVFVRLCDASRRVLFGRGDAVRHPYSITVPAPRVTLPAESATVIELHRRSTPVADRPLSPRHEPAPAAKGHSHLRLASSR